MQLNSEFTVEYFVADIQFQEWVVSDKQIHTDYWNEWLANLSASYNNDGRKLLQLFSNYNSNHKYYQTMYY